MRLGQWVSLIALILALYILREIRQVLLLVAVPTGISDGLSGLLSPPGRRDIR